MNGILSSRIILRLVIFILVFLPFLNVFAAENSLCASVKIEIKQELTLERQAFDANMKINNGFPNLTLENISIQAKFQDKDGNSVIAASNPENTNALFFISLSSITGVTNNDINGAGTILPSTTADIHWLIIPALGAANGLPEGTLYYVGATLSYMVGNEQKTVEVSPDYIFVKPMPELSLDYFFPKDVYGDDPFTPEIEPPVPFTLGVRAKNIGKGVARDVKIESAQPKIREGENGQGLLVNFLIIESWINNQLSTNNLLVDFDNILPNSSSIGRWVMECSLTGRFTEFTATYTHSDELGGQLTSVISALNTHTLIREVLIDLAGRDAVKDFLAKDSDVYKLYESDSIDTEVNKLPANLAFSNQAGSTAFYTLTAASATNGFMYAQVLDPYNGQKMIKEVIRSDGKNINLQNAWLSKAKNTLTAQWDYYFNLFDGDTTASYRIVFDDRNMVSRPPVLAFIQAEYTKIEEQKLSFVVEATDPDGTIPLLSAEPLPKGATFVDRNNGTAIFEWLPEIGQAGKYEVTFRASDGTLKDSQSVVITIQSLIDARRDFSLTFSPASKMIVQGQTASYTINVQPIIEGFDSKVTLAPSLNAAPAKGAINFALSNPVITPGTCELIVNTTEDVSAGSYAINLTGSSANKTHSILAELVVEEKFDITTAALPNGRVEESYTKILEAKGAAAPYGWSIFAGSLPNGLTLDPISAALSGTPTEKGYFYFTVEAKDASVPAKSVTKDFTMIIWPQPQEAFGEGALLKVTNSTAMGGAGIVLLFKDGFKEAYSFDAAFTNNSAINELYRLFAAPLIKFPINKADEWIINDNVSFDGYPAQTKFKVLEINETIVVPAGTFTDCVKIEETITFPDLAAPDFIVPYAITRWFAPRAGIIKAQINWSDNNVSTGMLQQYSVMNPKNKDYFPLKKDNYWEFIWDEYKSLENFTEKYTVTDFDLNIVADRFKVPYVSINDLSPYPNQGISEAALRVPCDTSIVGRIQSSLGLDEEKLAVQIRTNAAQYYDIIPVIKQAGLGKANDYWVSFNKPIRVCSALTADTLTDLTASWQDNCLVGMALNPNINQNSVFPIINNTATSITINGNMSLTADSGDAYQLLFNHDNIVDVRLNAQDITGSLMSPYEYSFKAESQLQHDIAKQRLPAATLDISNPKEYILSINSEDLLKGTKIKYSPDEPIAPRFGPLDEIPALDISLSVGLPANLEPAVVFLNPVTLILPCPGVSDLSSLEIYGYHPASGWRLASEIDGWIVANSRINHPETPIPTIEFQVYHFTGVQIGRIKSSSVLAEAYYFKGKYKNSFSADIKRNFTNNSISGWLNFSGMDKKDTINMASTSIKELKCGAKVEAIINGDCAVNGQTGYAFKSIMKDTTKRGSEKDAFSIEITGPDKFKFSTKTKEIDAGNIEIIWN